jgi:hypothetical protein
VDALSEEAQCHNLGEWQAIGALRKPGGIEAELNAELGMWRETAAALNAEPYPETRILSTTTFLYHSEGKYRALEGTTSTLVDAY